MISVSSSADCTDVIKERICSLSEIFDIYSDTSEISQLNRLGESDAGNELADFVKRIKKLNSEYGCGADICSGNLTRLWHDSLEKGIVPEKSEIEKYLQYMQSDCIEITGRHIVLKNGVSLDPGAAAKGYALDLVKDMVSDCSTDHIIVSTGSSTLLWSSDSSHVFTVAVKSDHDTVAGTVETGPCFVSTSGDYERFTEINGKKYHHILDMKTGFPSDTGLSSVTVFCDSGIMSDFLSTLIFAEGTEGLEKHLNSEEYSIVASDKQGNIYRSSSLIFRESE